MKPKISILTFQKTTSNYGAALQCYALWKYLESNSYDCEVIDLLRPEHKDFEESELYPVIKYKSNNLSKLYNSLLRRIKGTIQKRKKTTNNTFHSVNRVDNFSNFNSLINYSKRYCKVDDLYINPPIYDIYIVGSDQIWNPTIGFNISPYFLDFAPKNKKKISYAASIGIQSIPKQFHYLYANIDILNGISVRENGAKKVLRKFSSKNIDVVLDPVFLLGMSEWDRLIPQSSKFEFSYVFVYSVVDNYDLVNYSLSLADKISAKVVLALSVPPKYIYPDQVIIVNDAGPLEWINYLKYSKLVVTDSFHGLSFSLIFNKQFYIGIANNKRSSRIIEMLEKLNLKRQLISTKVHKKDFQINYTDVNNKLKNMINYSKYFLEINLFY